MKLVGSFLLLCMTVGGVLSWGGYSINFEHSDLVFDDKIMNMQVNMKRSDDKTIVNLNLELLEDIKDQIIFKVSQYEKVDGQYQHFVNSSISACNVLGRFKAHPIMKLVVKELLKSSSIPTHCPIKKGVYYMKDFSVNDDMLPPFIPTGSFMSKVAISRLVNEEQVPALSFTLLIDIDYAKDKKGGIKLF